MMPQLLTLAAAYSMIERVKALCLGLLALLAAAAASAEPIQLAPALTRADDAPAAMPDVATIEEHAWKLCRVHTTVLLNMPERSIKVVSDERLLALGEALDIEKEVPMTSGTMAALVRFRVRLRASVAKTPGVIYHVTTEALLASAVGFESDEVGRSQIRHAMLDISGPGTKLHEAYVSPELSARLVVAVEAEPVLGREEPTIQELVAPPSSEIRHFRVEAFLKERDVLSPIDQMTLAALDGQSAVFALSRFNAENVAAKDDRPLGDVTIGTVRRAQVTGFEKDHVVTERPAERSDAQLTSSQPDQDFLAEHAVTPTSDGPAATHSITRKNPKLSKKKREKIVAQQQIQAVRDFAIERSKTLPSGEDVPEGFDRYWFEVRLTPLNVTRSMMQVELRVEGRLKLPHEELPSTIAMNVVEQMPRGDTFELAVSELVHDHASDYDYIIRITPEP